MLVIDFTRQFKKDFKKYTHRKKVIDKFNDILEILVHEKPIPEEYHDHPLTGNYK